MALANLAAYKTAVANPVSDFLFWKTGTNLLPGYLNDAWAMSVLPGTAPTTAVIPTSATAGAIPFNNSSTERRWVSQISVAPSLYAGTLILADRLSHQGGLSGTAIGAQTTNLPTAALTRYTSGAGVMLGLSVYTSVGTTVTTVTATYTNQAGTAGRVTPAVGFGGGLQNGVAPGMVLMPLQDGDTGVRSVQSVTVGASTGTVGNFGVTLFRPLLTIDARRAGEQSDLNAFDGLGTFSFEQVQNDACLFWLYRGVRANTVIWQGSIQFSEA